MRREKSVERGHPGAAQALSWHDETLCKRALVLVGLTGGNHHPALDSGWTREVRMGTTPALFLARRCTYYAAPRRLGPDRGLGRPAGRRRFENVPAFRFSVILRTTTRADMASTLVRTISAALLSVSGGQMGCERPSQRERSYSAASGRCAKRKAALGSPRSRVSGSTWVFCASMLVDRDKRGSRLPRAFKRGFRRCILTTAALYFNLSTGTRPR